MAQKIPRFKYMVYVLNIIEPAPEGATTVNTTSRSPEPWSKALSPFYLGPVPLYGSYMSQTVENGYQYSKIYKEYVNFNGDPTPSYFEWAQAGWAKVRADQYPMGKGAKPEYAYWDGQKLKYIEARKKIYMPLYLMAVARTSAYKRLKELYLKGDIYLRDFDGYNHRKLGMTYEEVINNPKKTMGHAFILAMMLELGKDLQKLLL